MKMKFWLPSIVTLGLGLTATPGAQRLDELRIDVGGYKVGERGEQASARFSAYPLVLGQTTTGVLEFGALGYSGCGFSSGPVRPFSATAVSGWRIDVTPTKIVDGAVTFRLRWVRGWDDGKPATGSSGDGEFTLRSGESRPVDLARILPSARLPVGCDAQAASVRVAVAGDPGPDFDRRLVETDVWLVEYLPDRTERSQKVTVRGLYNQPTTFYFDSIDPAPSNSTSARELYAALSARSNGPLSLDIFGRITPRDRQGPVGLEIETLCRLSRKNDRPYDANLGRMTSALSLKPDDVASVELPKLAGADSEQFAGRVFSLRVRSRQIR